MPSPDHKAEALRLLAFYRSQIDKDRPESADRAVARALVYSNLAIAEAQERVAKALEHIFDRLDDLTEVDRSPSRIGDGPCFVRTRNV